MTNTNDNDNDNDGENFDMLADSLSAPVQAVLETMPELTYKGIAMTEAQIVGHLDMLLSVFNSLQV